MGRAVLQTPPLPLPDETPVVRRVSRRRGTFVNGGGFVDGRTERLLGSRSDFGRIFLPRIDVRLVRADYDSAVDDDDDGIGIVH